MSRLNDIWNNIRFPNRIGIVEYYYSSEKPNLRFCVLERQKDEIKVESCTSGDKLDALVPEGVEKLPVIAFVTGKKVLSKKVKLRKESISDAEVIAAAFPNIKRDQLVFEVGDIGEDNFMVSATRQEMVDELLQDLRKVELKPVDVCIGPFSLWSLLGSLDRDHLELGNFQYNFSDFSIRQVDDAEVEEISLFGQEIINTYAMAYLQGLRYFATRQYKSAMNDLLNQRKDHLFQQLFSKGLMGSAVVIFVLLLISFFAHSHFHGQNQELLAITSTYDQQINLVNGLKESYERKEQFLEINGSGDSRFAWMGDQLASSLTKGLLLSEMSFFPLERRMKKERLVRFYRDRLELKGETSNYDHFEEWLSRLNEFDWIEHIEITGYKEKNSSHRAEFSLQIELGS